jgi:orotate phosphoribosyltransferase
MTRDAVQPVPATRERLLQLLVDTKSFKYSDTPVFPLVSGAMSRFYVDCRLGLSYPEMRQVVGELMLDLVQPPVDAVGGLLVGAFPIAIAVSDAAFHRGRPTIRVFVARKEPKSHGMKKLIEGDVREGDRVIIVDDVITSGKSTIEAIQKSRDAGLIVTQALAIIDREEQDGKAKIQAEGVRVDALCTMRQLKDLVGMKD